MAHTEPIYDLMLLLDTEASDEQRAKVLDDAQRIVTTGGTVVSEHDWGTRPLAYEIDHKETAEYRLIQFNGGNDVLNELNRTLSIADGLIRYRIIKLAPGTPPPPDVNAAATSAGDFDASDE